MNDRTETGWVIEARDGDVFDRTESLELRRNLETLRSHPRSPSDRTRGPCPALTGGHRGALVASGVERGRLRRARARADAAVRDYGLLTAVMRAMALVATMLMLPALLTLVDVASTARSGGRHGASTSPPSPPGSEVAPDARVAPRTEGVRVDV